MQSSEGNPSADGITDSPRSAVERVRRSRNAMVTGTLHSADAQARAAAAAKSAALVRRTDELAQELAGLKDLSHAFERWHQDMISMLGQNRGMRSQGEDLATIVKQLIMLSLNAAIEAARAGQSARGFVVVAAEVRNLSLRAQALSKELGQNLHKNDLITTATFQDIQGGGKMMMAAISGLESMLRQLRADLE